MILEKGIIGSRLNKYLLKSDGCVGEYNANNTWNFNGNNRCITNNNRYNSNFRCRPCSDYIMDGESRFSHYPISLEEIQFVEEKSHSSKPNCVRFRTDKIRRIVDIWHRLNNDDVEITEARVFVVTKPKIREIIYCNYSDKLIQTFYVFSLRCYMENHWFDTDSYSCRQGKGVLKAVNQYREYIKTALAKYDKDDIYLASIDIKSFFISIDTKLLAEKMSGFINNFIEDSERRDKLLYLTKCLYVIDWHKVRIERFGKMTDDNVPEGKKLLSKDSYIGVPIGNWTSQVGGNFITTFALVFLRGLGYEYFVHYTDDTTIVVTDKAKYLNDIRVIEKFYQEVLHLELHRNKRYLQHYSKGITMLGRRIKFERCIPSKMTFATIGDLLYVIRQKSLIDESFIKHNSEHITQSINSYMGMLVHMTMFNYRKHVLDFIRNNFNTYFKIDDKEYRKINVRNKYTLKNRYVDYIRKKIKYFR